MYLTKPRLFDITCDQGDIVEVESQQRTTGKVLYVHINGITVLRICRIEAGKIPYTQE